MMGISTVLWREWTFFRHRFWKITSSQLVTPLLYILTFGFGLGNVVSFDGTSYLHYLVPGIVAMTAMRTSYSGVAMRVTVSRLHEQSYEHYLLAPMKRYEIALGYTLAGALRGVYCCFIILLCMAPLGVFVSNPVPFIISMVLTAFLFANLGFIASMVIDSHYDLNRFATFVITPMSFLCGTFFQTASMPWVMREIIELLPLTHSVRLMRAASLGNNIHRFSFLVIIVYAVILSLFAIKLCYETDEDGK